MSEDIVENYTSMFESGISVGVVEKLPEAQAPGKLSQTLSLRGLTIWKVVRRNAWREIAIWQTKQFNSYTKS